MLVEQLHLPIYLVMLGLLLSLLVVVLVEYQVVLAQSQAALQVAEISVYPAVRL
jgi:hypothetical protein